MGKVVKLRISGRAADTDAPIVEDMLDQIRDYIEILRGVEQAVAPDGSSMLVWRTVNAHKNSPLQFEFAAFPKEYALNVDRRTAVVVDAAAHGLHTLLTVAERPRYFTDQVLQKAERTFERVTNGLGLSEIDFGDGVPALPLTPITARVAAQNVSHILRPADRPYVQLGSVEGYFHGAERDGKGRRIIIIKARVTGELVKCVLTEAAASLLADCSIGDVWRNRRVQVYGRMHFRGRGRLRHVVATSVRFLRHRSDLPQLDEIVDPGFTGGLRTEEYLERLRSGDPA